MLKRSSAGTGFLHESFDVDDAGHFTRPWFAWVNGLFGELIVQLALHRPHILARQFP
jgi:meiotically up-regulated gene 157 (Mug157) protein